MITINNSAQATSAIPTIMFLQPVNKYYKRNTHNTNDYKRPKNIKIQRILTNRVMMQKLKI